LLRLRLRVSWNGSRWHARGRPSRNKKAGAKAGLFVMLAPRSILDLSA
jgi:hypothetical protein